MSSPYDKTYIILGDDKTKIGRMTRFFKSLSVLLFAVVVTLSLYSKTQDSNNYRDALREVNSGIICRSVAAVGVEKATTDLVLIIADGLVAVARDDDTTLSELATDLEQARIAVKEAVEIRNESIEAC